MLLQSTRSKGSFEMSSACDVNRLFFAKMNIFQLFVADYGCFWNTCMKMNMTQANVSRIEFGYFVASISASSSQNWSFNSYLIWSGANSCPVVSRRSDFAHFSRKKTHFDCIWYEYCHFYIKLGWFWTSELMEKTAYYTNVWQAHGAHSVSRFNIYTLVLSPLFLIIYPCQKQPPNVCYATQSVHL